MGRSRPEGVKHVEGFGPTKPGAHSMMAWKLRDRALGLGLKVIRTSKSSNRRSNSNYLQLIDGCGRHWKLRIADHFRPVRTEVPNFDLISRDGEAGWDWIASCVDRIATGVAEWFDPRGTNRPASGKQHRRIKHSQGERPVNSQGRPRR